MRATRGVLIVTRAAKHSAPQLYLRVAVIPVSRNGVILIRAQSPVEEDVARERKEERIQEAELDKQLARAEHAGRRQAATGLGGSTARTGTGTHIYDPTEGGPNH
ncbi:hypothetical protein SDJN03_20813, partial [Cucurbita argyrosperma subsp. sororia]